MTEQTKKIREKRQRILDKVIPLEVNQSVIFGPDEYIPQLLGLNRASELKGKRFSNHKLTALRSYEITRVA